MTDTLVGRLRADAVQLRKMIKAASFAGDGTSVRVLDPSGLLADLDEAAAEIERLTRERDEARLLVTEANNSLYGSQGYFHSINGGPFDKYHLANGIEGLKASSNRRWQECQAAESSLSEAVKALKQIDSEYEDHNFNHLDFRVSAKIIASEVLDAIRSRSAVLEQK